MFAAAWLCCLPVVLIDLSIETTSGETDGDGGHGPLHPDFPPHVVVAFRLLTFTPYPSSLCLDVLSLLPELCLSGGRAGLLCAVLSDGDFQVETTVLENNLLFLRKQ
jgi:hypothetical protein